MTTIDCNKGCCSLKVFPYQDTTIINRPKRQKAGVILHNPHTNKILVIQSRGNLWGFPKGSFEEGETTRECAIRELFEETGIQITIDKLDNEYKVNDSVSYFYVEYPVINTLTIKEDKNNDATGIGWIIVDCFKDLIRTKKIKINHHAKRCLSKFFSVI
jgi:8-oxo-dGTP pyrophosphatase MutT (NUDIX family)